MPQSTKHSISTIFKALEEEGGGGREGGGEERGYGGRKDERVTGEIVFTDDDSRCQTQTLHYECFADQARIEFEILPSKLTWKVAQTYL